MKQWSRRFVRSRRDRYRIYRSTGGLCARCLIELGNHWEIDHITRWIDGGDSRWSNLQPLCRRCHLLKTKDENTMGGPLRLANWGTQEEGDGPLRRGHKEGCLVACERFSRGEKFTSVILPTRYGKSHLARFITLAGAFGIETPTGIIQPFASGALFLTHRGFLSRQIIEAEKWRQFAKLFQVQNMPTITACEIKSSPARPQNICENGEIFAVTTIPMLSNNIDVFTDWVMTKSRIGSPPIIFADEAQFFGDGDDKKWGPALIELAQAGAFIMPMTATPMRADGNTIPGFKKLGAITSNEQYATYEEIGAVHPELGVVFDVDGNPIIWNRKSTWDTRVETAELDAHVRVERQEAWFHKYLCRLQRIRIQIRMTNGELLQDLSPTMQRKQLGRVIRDQVVVEEFLNCAEENLKEIRSKVLANAGVIVFVDATRDGDSHERMVERMVKKLKRIPIVATQESGNSQAQIDRFIAGEGDYLIVKNSAGAGLDCERLKVGVDLSSVRQFASCEQRWNRVGTPTNGKGGRITVATMITPADMFSDEIFDAIYTKQGGECKESVSALAATEYVPKGPPKPQEAPIFVDGVEGHDYKDTGGLEAAGSEIQRGKALVEIMAQSAGFNLGNITIPEGAQLATILRVSDEALGLTEEDSDPGDDFFETSTKIGQLRADNARMAKRLANLRAGVVDSDSMRTAWMEIYQTANQLIGARLGSRHFITGKLYRETNDIQVVDAVNCAINRLWQGVAA
ncbi:MAG: HNH endonuclease [Desulfocurvibacter africanus]